MWRYMEWKRRVALEQTMSSPDDILLTFYFSQPSVFLYPANSRHHTQTLSRGFRCYYALR